MAYRRKAGGKKKNFYTKRAERVAKQLGHDQPDDKNSSSKGGAYNKRNPSNYDNTQNTRQSKKNLKLEKERIEEIDSSFGYPSYRKGPPRLGWILNMVQTIDFHFETKDEQSGLDLYLLEENGDTFKCTIIYYPYFYVLCDEHLLHPMEQFLKQKFDSIIDDTLIVNKIDLELKNHLSGITRKYLKLIFKSEDNLKRVASEIRKNIWINKQKRKTQQVYGGMNHATNNNKIKIDLMTEIIDIREFDVPYINRVCIDTDLRVGNWFKFEPKSSLNGCCSFEWMKDITYRPDIKIFAFDIETEKAPLKFPNSEHDRIMMISYMIDNDGYLIVNREIVSQDIDDFEYTPRPEYIGLFTIFNEDNEEQLLRRFFDHIIEERPQCYAHYNGDYFDWPFIEKRAEILGLNMMNEIGIWSVISSNGKDIEYVSRFSVNLDCYKWVSRDSYLPQGSQGLKAVTRKKLGYNPVELDPEDMLPFARERPQELASYSVSDAVATYYLFKKYIQAFIFSLCQIIPLNSGDVLRKGTGTLCEALLMVQAYKRNIIAPNKTIDKSLKFYNGHLLEKETYIGGTVEAFESGVFRADIDYKFYCNPDTIDSLINNVDETIRFFIRVEKEFKMDDIDQDSFNNVRDRVIDDLNTLKLRGERFAGKPLIYHLDVAAMYPNIILTNRLQPVAIVNNEICASCDFNRPGKNCQRELDWKWRGKYFPAKKGEYNQLRSQIEYESFNSNLIQDKTWKQRKLILENGLSYKFQFSDLSRDQQNAFVTKRIRDYSQKQYRKVSVTKEEDRSSVVCQKENGFYVDTVRNFRDRRYIYKGLKKTWFKKKLAAKNDTDRVEAEKTELMYDSIQLAHKCILNSFYGYVMRKGSRWYSMDMAAITTHIGGKIIYEAYDLCKNLGKPLELDTDGIWTLLPKGFPENYDIKTKKGTKLQFEYPGSMLNLLTHQKYTNHQYQVLSEQKQKKNQIIYNTSSECSIFFEVDGPYKCMILPASTEEDRKLKKRYAVFDFEDKLVELKGFEIKRRGELQIIKIFQQEVFKTFLRGSNLQELYSKVAAVGKRWLDILDTKAKELSDEDVFFYITENKMMSKTLAEYGTRKSTAITCARRLAKFLGDNLSDTKGLSCKFIISLKPIGESVSQRAVPVEIFKADRPIMKQYIKKWLKDSTMTDFDIRGILDWDYYRKRVGSNIQKIITIPAAMQDISNPIPTLQHPSWLFKRIAQKNDPFKQKKISKYFKVVDKNTLKNKNKNNVMDIEDFGDNPMSFMATQKKSNNNNTRLNETDLLLNDSLFQDSMNIDSQDPLFRDSELQNNDSMMIDSQKENKRPGATSSVSLEAVVLTVDVDIDDDMDSWLVQSKLLWKQQKETKKRCKKKKRKRGVLGDNDADQDNNNSNNNKRRRMNTNNSNDNNNNNNAGVDGYFRLQQRLDELYDNNWQIIQIVATEESTGKFVLWIYVNNRLRRIKLIVPRPFYINVIRIESFPNLQDKGHLVSRALPRSRPSLNLLELELNEDEFQKDAKQISMFLTHPDVEGVYETNVPLIFRIISNIGCCSAVSQLTEIKNTHSTLGFNIKELEFRSTTQVPYLTNDYFKILHLNDDDGNNKLSRDSIKYLYFYHSTANNSNTNNDQRSIFAFLYQVKREKYHHYHCKLIAVSPRKKEQLVTPQIQQFTQELIKSFSLNHHQNIKISVKEVKVKNIELGYIECNKFLDQYKLSLNGPTIILLQSAIHLNDVYSNISNIADNYPVITFHFIDTDNKYPALQWYQYAVEKMIANWLIIPNQFEQKKGYSQYSHVPIGNLSEDVWSYTSDVFFSRLLSDNKHLWWISNGSRPDLGGLEEDENLFEDEHFNPTINIPGAYHTFCIELTISHLATNTILQSEHIQSLEMGTGCDLNAGDMVITDHKMADEFKENYTKSNIRIDDTSSTMGSFKILKKLIINWFNDVTSTSNNNQWRHQYADRLLMEFYRWLRSPSSKLYDPLLHRMVHRLMKKVWYQLIAQFKIFGAKIVYASFDKIIIETGKNRIENAVGYIASCLESIKKRELFEWLVINPTSNLWECLVWYDHANYGGYLLNPKDDPTQAQTQQNNPSQTFKLSNFDRELEVRWNIASYLPSFAEDCFDVIFGAYITDIRNEYHRLLGIDINVDDEIDSLFTQQNNMKKKKKKRKKNDKHEMDSSDDDQDNDSDTEMNDTNDNKDEAEAGSQQVVSTTTMLSSELAEIFAKYKQEMIDNQISHKIFDYITQIKVRNPKDTTNKNESADIFPDRPGSYLNLHDPALEFIKYLCLVLSLDKDVHDQVTILKQNLLRMVDAGFFSKISKFKNPCITYILPDVNCFKCKQSRDIDLCRDSFTKPLSLQTNKDNMHNNNDDDDIWNIHCNECGTLYNKDLVESMLLEVVRRRETAYHVQDILCKTCGKAKEDDMSEYCQCSGEFKNKESKTEFEISMKVFYNIARNYQFEYLFDTLDWITRDVV